MLNWPYVLPKQSTTLDLTEAVVDARSYRSSRRRWILPKQSPTLDLTEAVADAGTSGSGCRAIGGARLAVELVR